MSPDLPAADSDPRSKTVFNAVAAAGLVLLSIGMVAEDFARKGDLLFQSSASLLFACLFVGVLSTMALVVAVVPKRVVIGANLLLLCRASLGFPLSVWMDHSMASRIATVSLLVLSSGYLAMSLKRAGGLASRPWLQLRHSLVTLAACVVIGLVSLPSVVLGYVCGARTLIGDYVKLSPQGVAVVERVFRKDAQVVHLVGMMHIGDGAFYRGLEQRMAAAPPVDETRLVLTEGVADREHVIPADFANGKTYARWAKILGLESQEAMGPAPRSEAEDHSHALQDRSGSGVVWQNADIDVSDLEKPHRDLLVRMLETISQPDQSALIASNMNGVTGSQLEDLLKRGLILARNEALMKHFDAMAHGFSEIYIPWGAAHLPDIEKRLLARGYSKTSETASSILKFRK